MTPTFMALFVALGAVYGWRRDPIRVLLICCLFGGSAALLLPELGNATITPAVLFVPFFVCCAFLAGGPSAFSRELAFPGAGFWLLLLVMWCAAASFFLPRIFAGDVLVTAVTRDAQHRVGSLVALRPVSGNITQLGYALGSLLVFAAVRVLLRQRGGLERFGEAVLVVAGLNCFAALVNLAELYAGFPPMLEYVRNASYAILHGEEIAGVARITGTFAESSAFSGFTLPLFAFTATLWLKNVSPRIAGALAVASLVLLLLSTSTTAYVGLLACVACLILPLVWNAVRSGRLLRAGVLLPAAGVITLAVCAVLLFDPATVKAVTRFFDLTLFNKLESTSGVERSAWNYQAWLNFTQTYGLGVGLGSARASSYPLVLLSNIGAIGGVLYLAFLARLRAPRNVHVVPELEAVIPAAARQAVLATMIAATISATVFDLGIAFYAFAAAAATSGESSPVAMEGRAYA